jgi:hypothetical protein
MQSASLLADLHFMQTKREGWTKYTNKNKTFCYLILKGLYRYGLRSHSSDYHDFYASAVWCSDAVL